MAEDDSLELMPSSQESVVLPVRMQFLICRRYVAGHYPARAWIWLVGHAGFARGIDRTTRQFEHQVRQQRCRPAQAPLRNCSEL